MLAGVYVLVLRALDITECMPLPTLVDTIKAAIRLKVSISDFLMWTAGVLLVTISKQFECKQK